MDTREIRESFRRKRIRVLFVGESPPASGDFFYVRSRMTSHMRRAFEVALDREFETLASFLGFFRDFGCYLDDMTESPVDHMNRAQREQVLRDSIDSLTPKPYCCICVKTIAF